MIDEKKLNRGDLCNICRSADCVNCFSDDDFEKWIESQPKVGEWIPVSERPPEDPEELVLITVNGIYKNITFKDAVMLATYDKEEGWIVDGFEWWYDPQVTAWMLTPEPYGGKRE